MGALDTDDLKAIIMWMESERHVNMIKQIIYTFFFFFNKW